MRLRHLVALAAMAAAGAMADMPRVHDTEIPLVPPSVATPLIAEIIAGQEHFAGRPVAIYGLVVSVQRGVTNAFHIQDVSQMPLLVEAGAGALHGVGSQLLVLGTPVRDAGRIKIVASRIHPVKVLGGGGCC